MERYYGSFSESTPRKNIIIDNNSNNNNIMSSSRSRNYLTSSYFVGNETSYGSFLGGVSWPPRSYTCSFCKREFRSAQALGGHMNVHRRDRARLREFSLDEPNSNPNPNNPNPKPADKIVEEPAAVTISIPNLNLVPDHSSDTAFSPQPWVPERFHQTNSNTTTAFPSHVFSPSHPFVPSKPLYSTSGTKHVSTRPRSNTMKAVLFGVEEDRLLRRKIDIVRLDLKIGIHGHDDDDLDDDMDLELRLGYA